MRPQNHCEMRLPRRDWSAPQKELFIAMLVLHMSANRVTSGDLLPEIQSRQKLTSPGIRRERRSSMKRTRFTEEQIIAVLREAESGAAVKELCRRAGISAVTFYRWKSKFEGMDISEMRRLRLLEDENARLKKIVAQQALDIDALKAVVSKKW